MTASSDQTPASDQTPVSAGEPEPTFDELLSGVLSRSIDGFVRLVEAERLSGGASQETYRIVIETPGGRQLLAMRRAAGGEFEKPDETRPGLPIEAELMRAARRVGVPEPVIHHVLGVEDGLGLGFIMEWLEGETLGARILRAPELDAIRPRLAYECGQILARIHAIDPVATGLDQHLHVMPTIEFVHQMWDRYKEFDTPQPMIDFTARWLLDNLPPDSEPRLVHNDFRNGNIMVTPEGICAVLDWEVAHLGDPVRDLGWICTNSWRFGRRDLPVGGFGMLEDLLAGYEAESGSKVERAHVHFWEVFGSFWWAVGCLTMADRWRNGPDRTVERPGIARRSSECQVDCVNLIIPGPVELLEASPSLSSMEMPSIDELIISVREFLREDVRAATQGRNNFMALVASNSLDIVLRELHLGPAHVAAEHQRLVALLGRDDSLDALRRELSAGLQDHTIALDHPGLTEHLRATVVNQVAIDQPRYSGYLAAAEHPS